MTPPPSLLGATVTHATGDDLSQAQALAKVRKKKYAKLAQKLGELQPFPAVFPQECMG
jgi:hypothetical protein